MMQQYEDIKNLEPTEIWTHFAKICQIPHPSGQEQKISEYVKQIGGRLGLRSTVDKVGNVIITKPATEGMENLKQVILHGHLDMVADKLADSDHDFTKDPIEAYVDGDWVKARGTTLGADNGVGVAMALALLESEKVKHGPIKALFTVDEEVGFIGADALRGSDFLDGDILLNLDSEDEDAFFIGSAGGLFTEATFAITRKLTADDHIGLQVSIKGLHGGHSGGDIHLGLGNSLKILSRLLWNAAKKYQISLASIDGGRAPNAIPREAVAVIALPKSKKEEFVKYVLDISSIIKKELKITEPNLEISVTETTKPDCIMDEQAQNKFLNAMHACSNGVIRMSNDIPGLVETSTNLGVVKTEENKILVGTCQRSGLNSARDNIRDMIAALFLSAGAKVEHKSTFPAWEPNVNSEILPIMEKIYKEKFSREPKVEASHGGLECGIFFEILPSLDIVSFGPTILNPHSPNEKVRVSSVKNCWEFLLLVLENIPEK